MPEKQRPLKLFLVVLAKRDQQDLAIFINFFNIAIIPFTLVGYEVIIANSALRASLAIYHLMHIYNERSCNYC